MQQQHKKVFFDLYSMKHLDSEWLVWLHTGQKEIQSPWSVNFNKTTDKERLEYMDFPSKSYTKLASRTWCLSCLWTVNATRILHPIPYLFNNSQTVAFSGLSNLWNVTYIPQTYQSCSPNDDMCLFQPFACWAVGEKEKEGCCSSNTIDCYWYVDSG